MLAVVVLAAVSLVSCGNDSKETHIDVNPNDLYGLWYSPEHTVLHGFWRYNSDGTGTAWDEDEDVHEGEENTMFTWTLDVDELTHVFRGEQGHQADPKIYYITSINTQSMTWRDRYNNTYKFERQ